MIMFSWKSACILLLFIGVGLNFDGEIMAQGSTPSPISISTASSTKLYDEGIRYFETQEYELAIASFLKLLKIEPDNIRAYNTIGMSFGGLKKYPAAIAAFDRAIALDNNFANAYYNRGYIYQQLGNHNLALNDFDRTLTLTDKKHVSALINRASIYALQQNYTLALADLTRVVQISPESATAYYNRALIQLTIGNRTAYLNDLAIAEKLYRQMGDTSGLAQINRIRNLY